MSFSLPGTDLYYLPRDDLPPEKYEEIIRPVFAWPKIDSKYVFDDRMHFGFQLINMQERAFNGYTNQLPPHGPREREKLKSMIYRGEAVMLGSFSGKKGELFYINQQGELICRDPRAFEPGGAEGVIREYKRSVARRNYSSRGGKPRPTVLPGRASGFKQPAPLSTLNSKTAGRLLAAGGIYNGNPEGFRQAAQQLGGDAPAGYDQMMSEQAKGLLIAGASVVAGLTMGRVNVGAGKIALKITRKQVGSSYKSYALFRKDALIYSANKPINEQGLSAAARAWEKHAGRPNGVFIPLKGNVAQKNETASQFVNEVLNNENTVKTALSRGGMEYRLPDGRGLRYNSDGSLSGLLDPKLMR